MKQSLYSTFLILVCYLPSMASVEYEYDQQHRLTRAIYEDGIAITYEYDAGGNRTRRTVTMMADATVDGVVSFPDLATLASYWLNTACTGPDWCGGADMDRDGKTNLKDFAIAADQWLQAVGE